MSRHDPHSSVKDYSDKSQSESGVVDIGDRAKTYIFTEDGAGSIKVIGKGEARDILKEVAMTNDGRVNWGQANNGDGEHRTKIELFDEEKQVSDDFIALVEAANEGGNGLSLHINSASEIEIHVEGRWSTDILKFEGNFVTQALGDAKLGGFDLFNPNDEVKVFTFDNPDKPNEYIYTGRSDNLDQNEGAVGDILDGSFLNEGQELDELVHAALEEKYGLGDTKDLAYVGDDGKSLVVEVTNQHWKGPATDTMILQGEAVEEAMQGFYDKVITGGFIDPKDGDSEFVFVLDNDGDGQVTVLGAGNAQRAVSLDESGTNLTEFGNKISGDEIKEVINLALNNQGDDDLNILGGGEKGDNFISLGFTTQSGAQDVVVFQGDVVEAALEDFYA
ncbi:MAG: hypothetical protein AAFY02_11410 [Pseudomonadota bacterium]